MIPKRKNGKIIEDNNTKKFQDTFGISVDNNSPEKLTIQDLLLIESTKKDKTGQISDFSNILSYITWIVANLLSAFVLWTLVFIAMKSNKFTEKISSSVNTYVK
jgi:hypothetical protein